jgi:hypothetical protein
LLKLKNFMRIICSVIIGDYAFPEQGIAYIYVLAAIHQKYYGKISSIAFILSIFLSFLKY